MKKFLDSSIGRFRLISFAEGMSYLILLFIAMPLKYMYGLPVAVKMAGSLHGFLFVLYLVSLFQASLDLKWQSSKTLYAFIASLVPFGAFALDSKFLKEQHENYSN